MHGQKNIKLDFNIYEKVMGSACGTNWGEERCMQLFSGESWRIETAWKT